jgi:hypothetical protein
MISVHFIYIIYVYVYVGGVMVSMLTSSVVDSGFEPWSKTIRLVFVLPRKARSIKEKDQRLVDSEPI